MNCMKCGREIPLGQVFCKDCLLDMEQHPVKPGTPVILPPQKADPPRRTQTSKKVRKPEDQLKSLRKTVRWLIAAVLILAMLLGISVSMLLRRSGTNPTETIPGQNYSTEESVEGFT